MATAKVVDRSAAREMIRERLEAEARAAGYDDYAAQEAAEYAAWQSRAGLNA